jgi:hypothetical protein
MRYAVVLIGLLGVLVLAIASWPSETRSFAQRIQAKGVEPGQSQTEVRAALGEPTEISRTDTYWKTTEDWIYREGNRTFVLTFEAGKLLRITERLVSAGRLHPPSHG